MIKSIYNHGCLLFVADMYVAIVITIWTLPIWTNVRHIWCWWWKWHHLYYSWDGSSTWYYYSTCCTSTTHIRTHVYVSPSTLLLLLLLLLLVLLFHSHAVCWCMLQSGALRADNGKYLLYGHCVMYLGGTGALVFLSCFLGSCVRLGFPLRGLLYSPSNIDEINPPLGLDCRKCRVCAIYRDHHDRASRLSLPSCWNMCVHYLYRIDLVWNVSLTRSLRANARTYVSPPSSPSSFINCTFAELLLFIDIAYLLQVPRRVLRCVLFDTVQRVLFAVWSRVWRMLARSTFLGTLNTQASSSLLRVIITHRHHHIEDCY